MCQESLKKFREEAEKLEKSESLQKAREKYVCLPLSAVLYLLYSNCVCCFYIVLCSYCLFIFARVNFAAIENVVHISEA